jgi:hypothetical protein
MITSLSSSDIYGCNPSLERLNAAPVTEVSHRLLILVACAWLASLCHSIAADTPAPPYQVLISVPDQRLAVVCNGQLVARFPVSTSRYGTGDRWGSYQTPLGDLRVCDKIGGDLTPGAVIRHRSATGEVIPVNAPGRDPIVTRVIWLDGLEAQNKNAHARGIYIHGTPEERTIGTPASYGCIRMRSKDVIKVFDTIPVGTVVSIIPDKLPHMHRYEPPAPAPEPQALIASAPPAPTKPDSAPQTPAPTLAHSKPAASPAKSFDLLARSPVSPLLPPIGEAPEHTDNAALRSMKGSILLANLPPSDSDHRSKSSQPQ